LKIRVALCVLLLSTSWAEDHIEITGIYGIDKQKQYSILGERGDQFWKEVWGYPNIGIYICDCPSAGHDMVALDYTSCGNNGEPKVVHVDQESDYEITVLASNFQEFIENLYFQEEEDNDEENQVSILWKEDQISFEIKNHSFFGTVLQLNQQLKEGETGWSLVNLKIPEEWEGASISKMKGCIIMKYKEDEYHINSENQGKLLSNILDLDEDNDDELKGIWDLYAKVT